MGKTAPTLLEPKTTAQSINMETTGITTTDLMYTNHTANKR